MPTLAMKSSHSIFNYNDNDEVFIDYLMGLKNDGQNLKKETILDDIYCISNDQDSDEKSTPRDYSEDSNIPTQTSTKGNQGKKRTSTKRSASSPNAQLSNNKFNKLLKINEYDDYLKGKNQKYFSSTFRLYKSIMDEDIRHVYPRFLQDAFNTSNHKHIENVLRMMFHNRSKVVQCHLVDDKSDPHSQTMGPQFRSIEGVENILNYTSDLMSAIPDAIFCIRNFKMIDVKHVPKSFSTIPLSHFEENNIHLLNTRLLSQLSPYEEPCPGQIMVLHTLFSGTKMYDIKETPTTMTSSSSFTHYDIPTLSMGDCNFSDCKKCIEVSFSDYFIESIEHDAPITATALLGHQKAPSLLYQPLVKSTKNYDSVKYSHISILTFDKANKISIWESYCDGVDTSCKYVDHKVSGASGCCCQ